MNHLPEVRNDLRSKPLLSTVAYRRHGGPSLCASDMSRWEVALAAFALSLGFAVDAVAQAANAGADFNKAERARAQEDRRLQKVDPPIKPDPLGNAIMGGVVTGAMRGAAAGAVSTVRGAAVGGALQEGKQIIERRRTENQKSGRGGSDDPRYNPGTLIKQR